MIIKLLEGLILIYNRKHIVRNKRKDEQIIVEQYYRNIFPDKDFSMHLYQDIFIGDRFLERYIY